MKGFEFAIIALVLVCAGLAVTFYLTTNEKSGAVVVPSEFAEKKGAVAPLADDSQSGGESAGLVGRAYDSALFTAEKAVLSPSEAKGSVSGPALLFIALVTVLCVLVWVRSR